jgi:hypothetical protein
MPNGETKSADEIAEKIKARIAELNAEREELAARAKETEDERSQLQAALSALDLVVPAS